MQAPLAAFRAALDARRRAHAALMQARRPGGYRQNVLPHPGMYIHRPFPHLGSLGMVGGDIDRLPGGGLGLTHGLPGILPGGRAPQPFVGDGPSLGHAAQSAMQRQL
jgi:hypothetical protein